MLLEREHRARIAAYTSLSLGVLNASIYASLAAFVERSEARPLFAVGAGTILLNAAVNFIIHLTIRTPSESIALGLPPPAGANL